MDIGYRMENLSGICIKPDETYVRQRGDKWFAFAKVGGIVFKCPKPFDTFTEAYEQAKATAHGFDVE